MNTISDTSSVPFNRSYLRTPSTLLGGDVGTFTNTTMSPVMRRQHENSAASLEQNPSQPQTQSFSDPEADFGIFSTKLMRNKTLLVPTRLALKRQRAPLKPSAKKLAPIYTDKLQMELGNPDESRSNSDYDEEELKAMTSPIHSSVDHHHHYPRSILSRSPLREGSPRSLPTDISLLYREKPVLSHPITGGFIVQYTEENGSPSPCSYILPRKSLREKNAPAFTFGSRCLVEKRGGSRTSWHKQWFAHSDPHTTKVDFNRETVWPTPFHYPAKPTLGQQVTKVSFPAWTIGTRLQTNATTTVENSPSPDTYDTLSAFKKLTAKNTQFTFKTRAGGTQVSTNQINGEVPGPNAYNEKKFLSNKCSAPKHSFGKRIPTSWDQDPYVNTLPPLKT